MQLLLTYYVPNAHENLRVTTWNLLRLFSMKNTRRVKKRKLFRLDHVDIFSPFVFTTRSFSFNNHLIPNFLQLIIEKEISIENREREREREREKEEGFCVMILRWG
jgi:hypothetical protein